MKRFCASHEDGSLLLSCFQMAERLQAQPGSRQMNGAVSLEPLNVVLVTKSNNPKRKSKQLLPSIEQLYRRIYRNHE